MVFSSMPALTAKHVKGIALVHVAALILSTLISYVSSDPLLVAENPRMISLFVNHIRLSLLLVMGIVLIIRYNWSNDIKRIILNLAVILWFIYFLWIMEAATGIAILFVLLAFYGLRSFASTGKRKWIGISSLLILFIGLSYVAFQAQNYWKDEVIDESALDTHTAMGNAYIHDLENHTRENGKRIWMYISDEELAEAWSKRSSMHLMEKDKKGQPLRGTLLRYMTSLDLRKDAAGLAAMSNEQIKEVENGVTSALAYKRSGLNRRMEVLFFEIDSYINGGDPSLNSMTRRFEYWKAGWGLFKARPLMGYGAGNLREDIKEEFKKDSRLSPQAWNLIHNQFLTFMACFGIIGLLWLLYAHYYPASIPALRNEVMLWAFLIVLSVSYMSEDTLNTQAGLSFFIFYEGLLVLGIYRPSSLRTSS